MSNAIEVGTDRTLDDEVRHRLLIESLTQAVWETDGEGVVVADSPSWRAYTGQTLDQWLGNGWLEAIHPDDRAFAKQQWQEAMFARKLVDAEFRLRAPDGGWRWTNMRAAPVMNVDGAIDKWVGMNIDIDARKRAEVQLRESEGRQAFLLKLGDTLRPLSDPLAMQNEAARVLGQHLGAGRAAYAEIDADDAHFTVHRDFTDGVPSFAGRYPLDVYGAPEMWSRLRAGRTISVTDAKCDTLLIDAERAAYAASQVRAAAAVPLVKQGRLAVVFFLHFPAPREWTSADLDLVGETAERTWAAVERARAEAALRESEEKYRSLFETMDQGYGVNEVVRDAEGRAIDIRYLELNPTLERLTGVLASEAVGRLASEVFPGLDRFWVDVVDRVVTSGAREQVEHELTPVGRWYQTKFYPIGGDRCVSLYDDITKRKETEAALRASEERQAFLLKLADAVRPLAKPADIQGETTRLLREQLNAGWCYYVDWDLDRKVGLVLRDSARNGLPSLAGAHDVSDAPEFLQLLTGGAVLTVRDYESYEQLSTRIRQQFVTLGFRSMMVAPLVKSGRLIASMLVGETENRAWSPNEASLLLETAERTWAAVQRARAEAALRESEERLRLIVESARDYAIYTVDVDRNVDTWLPGAEAVFGWTREEIEGRSGDILFTPEDRDAGVPPSEAQKALADGEAPDVRWHLHKDGHRVFIEGQSVPLFEGGTHSGFLKIGQDVTSRRAAQEALRESEERLRQFGEASQDVLWIRDPDTLQLTYLTPAFETIYGLSREGAMSGDNFRNWLDAIVPEDRDAAASSINKVRQGERVTFEYRILRATDGKVRWLRDTDFPIFDEAGRVRGIGGIGQDITDEKEGADRMAVLVAELQHRTRNLMGVVRATAERTGETSTDYPDFQHRFRDRLDALARVQGLLSRLGDTDRVAFDELIRAELQAMQGTSDRVTLRGPKGIRLRSSMVQTLAMALHELATNAVKYGALGQPNAHLTVAWNLEEPDINGRRRLHIDWKETGVTMPPAGTEAQGGGQGRELIEEALPYQLNADTSFRLGPDGVHCTIDIEVSDTTPEEPSHG